MKSKSKSKKMSKDPFAKREASNYQHPVASREYLLAYLEQLGQPVTHSQLIKHFKLKRTEEQEGLRRRLKAMVRDGQLMANRREAYVLVDKMSLISGTVIGQRDGSGYLKRDDGQPDLFITTYQMRRVFHGDRVLVREQSLSKGGRRRGRSAKKTEATIVDIIERGMTHVVGRFMTEQGMHFVVPDHRRLSQDILIPSNAKGRAHDGQVVQVEIVSYPSFHQQAVGKVMEVLGDPMAPGMEVDIAIRAHQLPHIWSDKVHTQVKRFGKKVSAHARAGRHDMRDKPFVTIDGEDARDFDDAVYCEVRPRGGWTLYVAIADVSHYVKPGSPLDQDAMERGTSVYFPGHVIPMLPTILSNELCSLKPKVDRLVMICQMQVSAEGRLTRYHFHEGVIHSHARLTYTEVAKMLDPVKPSLRQQYQSIFPHLVNLHDLFKVLQNARAKRGAIDFDTVETRILFDKKRKIKAIVPVKRNHAHRLIEECMLLANVATARFLQKHKIPTLFRVHEGPTEEKLIQVREFLGELGLTLRGGKKPEARDYAHLLARVKKRDDAELIQTILLRSLSQAIYHPKNAGHFGLAYTAYTHFTSPIRRYPDLLVHRAIRHILQQGSSKDFDYSMSSMIQFGEQCSQAERRADDATREAVDWLKCEYMQNKVGEEFSGVITGVTNFGIFVKLTDIYVEGLVHITALENDYYHYDAAKHRLMGERTGKQYNLIDPIRVRVADVDLDERQIDFECI